MDLRGCHIHKMLLVLKNKFGWRKRPGRPCSWHLRKGKCKWSITESAVGAPGNYVGIKTSRWIIFLNSYLSCRDLNLTFVRFPGMLNMTHYKCASLALKRLQGDLMRLGFARDFRGAESCKWGHSPVLYKNKVSYICWIQVMMARVEQVFSCNC